MSQVADPIQQQGQRLMTLPRAVSPDEGSIDLDGHYCLKTDEFKCGCRERLWDFIHYSKKIVVWPEKDDPKMLDFAQKTKELGLNPRVIEYKVMMGKAIPWDDIPQGADIG